MFVLIGPSAQTTVQAGVSDLPQAAQQTRQIRGPMGEDAESNLVNHCIPRDSARQHDQQQDDQAPSKRPDPPIETVWSKLRPHYHRPTPIGMYQPNTRPGSPAASATTAPDRTRNASGWPAPPRRSPGNTPARGEQANSCSPRPGAAHVMISQSRPASPARSSAAHSLASGDHAPASRC